MQMLPFALLLSFFFATSVGGVVANAQDQDQSTVSYGLRVTTTEKVEKIYRPLIETNPDIRLDVDPTRNRLRVTGPLWAHELMEQILDRLDRAPTATSAPTTAPAQLMEPRASSTETSRAGEGPNAPVATPASPAPATPAAAAKVRRQLVPLPQGSAAAVRRDLLQLLGQRLQVPSDPNQPWVLNTTAGPLHIGLDLGREDILLDGPSSLVDQFSRLLNAIIERYQPPVNINGAERNQRVVLLRRSVHADVRRLLQTSATAMSQQQQWQRERLAALDPNHQVILKLAGAQQPPPVPPAAAPVDQTQLDSPNNPGNPALPQLEGVDIELLPDLDAIILKGREQDLEQLAEIIQQLEQLSRETQPAMEIIHLRFTNSGQLAELIEDTEENLLGNRQGRAQVTPLGTPNALLIVGWGDAVAALKELITKLDRPVDPDTQFRVFPLKYASASALQTTITNFFAGRPGLGPTVESTVDARTNSIIVHAAPRDMLEVAKLIERLDTPSGRSVQRTRVIEIRNSLASDVADTLRDAIAATPSSTRNSAMELVLADPEQQRVLTSGSLEDVQITVDPRKNTLIISALAENFPVIEALIEQLDAPGMVAKIKIFPIRNSDAASLVQTLRSLLPSQAGTDPISSAQLSSAPGESSLAPLRFTVDVRSNSIIATGSDGDLKIVDALITRLDEADSMQRKNTVYQLKNSPAVDVALAINEFLRNTRQVENATPGTVNPYEQLEKEVVVVPEPVSNKLIVSATERYFADIQQIIERLDAQPPQVMIQALIAEIALDDAEEFGIELGIQDSVLFDRSLLGDLLTVTNSTQTSTPAGILTATEESIVAATNNPGFDFNSTLPLGNSGSARALQGAGNVGGQGISNFAVGRGNAELGFGGLVLSASSQNVNVLLRALEESRRLEVLSRPQVLTLDNQPAFIQVGQRVPRITGSSINQVGQQNTVDLENVGLILGVTPRISPEGNVTMEIDAEKSSIGPESEGIPVSVSADGTIIRSPRVDVTSAQTTVSAADGETIILGGLITNNRREVHRRVPYLSDIPIIKHLFRFDSFANRRTELIIILTPHIVRSPEDIQRLKEIEMARMSWCAADIFEMHGEVFTTPENSLLFNEDQGVEVIYPHVDPRGTQVQQSMERSPAPGMPSTLPPPTVTPTSPPFLNAPEGIPAPPPEEFGSGLRLQAPTYP